MSVGSGDRDGIKYDRAALGKLVDRRELALEMRRGAMRSHGVEVDVQLVEREHIGIVMIAMPSEKNDPDTKRYLPKLAATRPQDRCMN
ncbi:hypothetical protein [Sphingomonas sp. BK036]|uniref:hypothetical protein n=1 Tax=Sphingomonas sp. BK036 TaxID=2512122 RepID=UPI0013EE9638|nr:hypothetical protein [Sphingomonas sp. BK036]